MILCLTIFSDIWYCLNVLQMRKVKNAILSWSWYRSWFTFSLWLLCCEYFHVFIGHLYLFRDMFLPALYLLFNLVVFFIIELLELLCVIYTSLFSDIWFANIFSISKLLFSCQCPLKHNFIQKLIEYIFNN